MNKHWILNGLGVIVLFISLIVVGSYFLSNGKVIAELLAFQLITVLLLATIGSYNPVIKGFLKSLTKPPVQFAQLIIIGSLASFLSVSNVSALIPEDPFLFKNALLASTLLTSVFLWLIIINVLLFFLYLHVGYKSVFTKKNNSTSQQSFHSFVIFIGLGVSIIFVYKPFMAYATDGINTIGSRLIVHSQFQKNIRCTNLPKNIYITSVSNNEVLEFLDSTGQHFEYKRHKCSLVKDTSLNNWPVKE